MRLAVFKTSVGGRLTIWPTEALIWSSEDGDVFLERTRSGVAFRWQLEGPFEQAYRELQHAIVTTDVIIKETK